MKFNLLKQFNITVPKNYNWYFYPKTQLKTFKKKHQKEFYYYNENITDKNFKNENLKPNKTYTVKLFGIENYVTSQECLDLYRSENAILTGAQGASIVYQEAKDELIKGKWYISFDTKQALWKDSGGRHQVPGVLAYSDGDYEFLLGLFECDWASVHCVLCFCDCENLDTLTASKDLSELSSLKQRVEELKKQMSNLRKFLVF